MDTVNKLKAGMKELSEVHDPHMLDVSELIARTREKVSERTIARSCMNVNIPSVVVQEYLVIMH